MALFRFRSNERRSAAVRNPKLEADLPRFRLRESHKRRRLPSYKTRADTPAEESISTALLSNETNVSAPSHLPW